MVVPPGPVSGTWWLGPPPDNQRSPSWLYHQGRAQPWAWCAERSEPSGLPSLRDAHLLALHGVLLGFARKLNPCPKRQGAAHILALGLHLAGCSGAGAGPQAFHPHPNPPPRGEGKAAGPREATPSPRGGGPGWGFYPAARSHSPAEANAGPPPGDVLRFPRGGGKPPGGGQRRRKARASPRTPKLPRCVSQADRPVRACVSGVTIALIVDRTRLRVRR
jgi:hypothetical protein